MTHRINGIHFFESTIFLLRGCNAGLILIDIKGREVPACAMQERFIRDCILE